MIPAPFTYLVAHGVDEALALLAEHGGADGEAKLLAGGHSLLPMMKLRLSRPAVLVDLGGIEGLSYLRAEGDELAIGALTRHATLAASDLARADAPLLAHAAGQVGDPQVRHRGTIGGSLAHADPAADLPMALLAHGGTIVAAGAGGARRAIPVDEFFTGFFDTALADDEMILEIRVPRRPGTGWGYEKFVRRANDWAIVGVATTAGRVTLANMGPRPLHAIATERGIAAGMPVAQAAALAADDTDPVADLHAEPDYRRHLARVLTARALVAAGA